MASTYYYADITNIISRFIPKVSDSDLAAFIANQSIYEIWERYDWRESLVKLPPIYLIPNEQDLNTPAASVPTDFLGLRQAYLVQLNSGNPAFTRPLGCLKDLGLTNIVGLPTDVGYESSTNSFRVFPRTPNNIGAPNWIIKGVYKKRPTKLTATTISSTLLPFDDMYLGTMVEVFKWAAWNLAGDPRAGGVQKTKNGGTAFTGQYATAMEAIDSMAANEGLEMGDVSIAPAAPLALTYMNGGWGFHGGTGWGGW